MPQESKTDPQERDPLYAAAEVNANLFNLKCLVVLCLLAALSEVLNEFGLFRVPRAAMLPSMIIAFVLFSLPVAVYLIHDRLLRRQPPVIERESFKDTIIRCAYIGIAALCVSLSSHTVILLAVPSLIAAQYRSRSRQLLGLMIASVVLVLISVYGGYFFGAPDRNFIKGMLTDEESVVLSNRLAIATPERMVELFLHYALPRLLGLVAVVLLTFGVTRRNGRMLRRQAALAGQVRDEMARVNSLQSHVIDALATLIETRDLGTGEHVARTKRYVRMIADEMRRDEKYRDLLTEEVLARIESAAPLHDVGKIAVSDTILLKPAKLTEEEFAKMKTHTVKGRAIIQNSFSGMGDDAFLQTAGQIAGSHHEWWNGAGYPEGLAGEQVPLSARIMAVADVYDALVSTRVYKGPISPEEAIDTIVAESGTHFDPDIVSAVQRIRGELIETAKMPLEQMLKR